MFESLKLSDLPKRKSHLLRRPSSTRPAIWFVEENRVRAVVKDFSTNSFLFRNTIGRFLVWREGKAYRRLKGVKGVPIFYRVIGGLALVVEEIPGRDLENIEKEERLPEKFFDALKGLVDRCHERGVAHCDLKRVANTLRGQDGLPYIIDWGASISEKEFRFFPMAIIKMKLRHIPEAVTREEKKRYNYRSGAERLIRAIRDRLRDILQKIA
jgi:serine/threonine protein kinase